MQMACLHLEQHHLHRARLEPLFVDIGNKGEIGHIGQNRDHCIGRRLRILQTGVSP
jgi:hypothetical protein